MIYHPRCVPNGGKKTSFVRKIFLASCGAVAEALLLDHLPASGPTTPSSQSLLPAEAMLLGVQLHTARPANRSLVSPNTFPPHSKELLLRCDALYKSHGPGEMPPVLFPNSTALHYRAAVPERQVCASPKHDLSGGFGIFSQFLFFSPHLYLTSLWMFSQASVSQAAGLQKQSYLADEKLNHSTIGFPFISTQFSAPTCFVLLCLSGQ